MENLYSFVFFLLASCHHFVSFDKIKKDPIELYDFLHKNPNNAIVKIAKQSDIIVSYKNTDKIDTRAYIDLEKIETLKKDLNKLYEQYKEAAQKGENTEKFFKKVKKLKRCSIITNIGTSIFALGILAPGVMLIKRKFFDQDSEFQTKEETDTKGKQETEKERDRGTETKAERDRDREKEIEKEGERKPRCQAAPQAPTAGKSPKPSQPFLSGGGSVSLSSALCRGYARQAATSRRFSAILSTASRGYWNIKSRLSYLPAAQWSRCQKSSLSA